MALNTESIVGSTRCAQTHSGAHTNRHALLPTSLLASQYVRVFVLRGHHTWGKTFLTPSEEREKNFDRIEGMLHKRFRRSVSEDAGNYRPSRVGDTKVQKTRSRWACSPLLGDSKPGKRERLRKTSSSNNFRGLQPGGGTLYYLAQSERFSLRRSRGAHFPERVFPRRLCVMIR